MDDLKATGNLYLSLGHKVQDEDGFIMSNECDSLLFSCLYAVGGGKVDILAAMDIDGMWHRRPTRLPECYPCHSKSTISRDMLLGVLWYIWEKKRLDLAEEMFKWGRQNSWIMGNGDISRIWFVPGLQATLAEIIYRLGGPNYKAYRHIPQSYTENIGYAAHLDVLHILLRGNLTGKISEKELSLLKIYAGKSPRNPLYQYAFHRFTDRDYTSTIAALSDERIFPSNRLPTSHDRSEPWINQRDPGDDWEPSGLDQPPKLHSGGDFLFVLHLLLKG